MNTNEQDSLLLSPKRYYIKRKTFKNQQSLINGSIFNLTPQQNQKIIDKPDDYNKKYQTITTNLQNNTINTNHILSINSGIGSGRQDDHHQLLPVLIKNNIDLSNRSNKDQPIMKTITSQTSNLNQHLVNKPKSLSHHVSDPFYLHLQKTVVRRMTNKFKDIKRQWANNYMTRKQKSLIGRALEKSIKSINQINENSRKRRNTTNLQQLLRNNIQQKKFILPANFKPQIQGLKGKGGKLIPLSTKSAYRADQVYKYSRNDKNLS